MRKFHHWRFKRALHAQKFDFVEWAMLTKSYLGGLLPTQKKSAQAN
jgi:hypothetical protein